MRPRLREIEPGVPVGRHRDWIPITTLAVPTVWMATADGLVLIDLVAVERAVNGLRKGWTLTPDEARYTAGLMLDRGMPYSLVARRVGASGATMQRWFPEQAVPVPGLERPQRAESGPSAGSGCGTRRGYQRHRHRKEPPCSPCRSANTAADRHYRLHGTYVGAPTVPL